ncbi:MAG: DUF1028 domain-containing protein [Bacteroidota bacterium]
MKHLLVLICLFALTCPILSAQDTFSIVALDTLTGEVGAAGASCVDLFAFNIPDPDFLAELFPGQGAIASQAFYIPANQQGARVRMNTGDTPEQIIQWLITNDIENNPAIRQYGIVGYANNEPQAAAYTGLQTDDFKGQIVGRNYAIQGNILSGREVLDSMEARFLRAEGDLSCKLMAAMQGANRVGADARCSPFNTSSLFAFLKVAQPTDMFESPSFSISLRTRSNDFIEPIDSLQSLFDLAQTCLNTEREEELSQISLEVLPNPAQDRLTISIKSDQPKWVVEMREINGKLIEKKEMRNELSWDVSRLTSGLYLLRITSGKESIITKWIKMP